MFHSDTERKTIWVSDDNNAGMPSNIRLFTVVETPDGRVERKVVMPMHYPTVPALSSPDLSTIHVTSACWPVNPGQRVARPLEGDLFAFEAPCPGLPATRPADEFA